MVIKIRNVEEDKFEMEGKLTLPVQIDPETKIAQTIVVFGGEPAMVEYGPEEYEMFELPEEVQHLKSSVYDEQALIAIDYAYVLGYNAAKGGL